MRPFPLVIALFLVAAGSASIARAVPRPQAGPPPQNPGETARELTTPDEETAAMRALLERSLADPDLRQSLELLTECRNETGMRAMRLWGDGLGIWQRNRQIQLDGDDVSAVLNLLQAADFAAFAPLYGGLRQEDPREHDRPQGSTIDRMTAARFSSFVESVFR